eukprot:gene13663-29047_t
MEFLISLVILLAMFAESQYTEFSNKFNEVMASAEEDLLYEIIRHPDYIKAIYPDGPPIPTTNFIYSYPDHEDYQIGLLIDPCRNLAYNCCIDFYGTPEYLSLKKAGLEKERVVRKLVLANDSIISSNGNFVYENGERVTKSTTSTSYSRMPDDEVEIDLECKSSGVPYQHCIAHRIAKIRSTIRPPCTDNNNSLNVLSTCITPDGTTTRPYCVQVGFSQNAFIAQCHPNFTNYETCGTFLEVHLANGSPYVNEESILSETKLPQNSLSGYTTTTIDLTWKGNMKKVLCAYSETVIRVGSHVYVNADAPKCCCPLLRYTSRLGAFFCPIAPSGGGPFAARFTSVTDSLVADGAMLEYPFCLGGIDSDD